MSDDKAQTGTGGEEQRREGLGSSLVNEQEALTGVSNGSEKEIAVTGPLPQGPAAKETKAPQAVVAAGGEAVAVEEDVDPKARKADPVVPQKGQPVTTTAKKEDEYQRDQAQAAAAATEEEEIRDTKKMRQLLNDKWGLQWPDPVLHGIMQKGSVTKGFGGIVFELEGGETIKWHENLLQQGEFVGKTGFFAKMNEAEAEATVAVAKNRGWTKLNVYGNRDQKEMLWLEAKKQGLEVANFAPMADSPIHQKWAQMQQERADKTLAGVQNADNAPISVQGEVKPGADERPGRRDTTAPAAEEEEGDKPKDKKADGEQPKPVAASAIAGKSTAAQSGIALGSLVRASESALPPSDAPAEPEKKPVETVPGETPKGAEAVKAFFSGKIDECTHPKMKEALQRICNKLTTEGVDETLVKDVCDKLNSGRINIKMHNEVVGMINAKITTGEPLVELGFRQPQQQQRGPGMKP